MAATPFLDSASILPRFEVIKPRSAEPIEAKRADLDLANVEVTVPSSYSINSNTSSGAGEKKRKVKSHILDTRANRTIFIGNIPVSCTKKHIKLLFKPYCSVESIRLRSMRVSPGDMPSRLAKRTQKQLVKGSTFNAYVVVPSCTEAESCLALNGTILQGRHLRVDLIVEKKLLQTQWSVFIGNLPFNVDEEKLREVFNICGEIENVRVVRDSKSGIGKGFGFVTFADRSGVMFALKQNKKVALDKRTLRVCRCKDQSFLEEERQAKLSGIRYNSLKSKPTSHKLVNSESKSKLKLVPSGKKIGKRRTDGTKNRYYRLPVH